MVRPRQGSFSRVRSPRVVNPGWSRQRWRKRQLADEAFGVCSISRLEDPSSFERAQRSASEVDVGRAVEAQGRVEVRLVVPAEEPLAKSTRIFDRAEPVGKLRTVLEGLELRFGIRIVAGAVRARVA